MRLISRSLLIIFLLNQVLLCTSKIMNKANKRAAKQARYDEKKRKEKKEQLERQRKETNRKRRNAKNAIRMSEHRKKLKQEQNGTKNESETNSQDVVSGSTETKRDSETKEQNGTKNDSEKEPNTNESFYLQRVAKYFDQDTEDNDKSESKKLLYFGTITSSKPVKSDNGILLWHVQYDDDDSEDFNKLELMEAIKLYRTTSGLENGVYPLCNDIDTDGPTKKALEILTRTKQIHKDKDGNDKIYHKMPVCTICDRFIKGCDEVQCLKKETILRKKDYLSTEYFEHWSQLKLPMELRKQYQIDDIKLKDLLLSP